MLIAEHSMCQPGRPSPIAVSHDGSPGLAPFHSAKSRTSSLAYSSASTRSPTRSCSGIEAGQPAVRRPRGDPEEDRPVVGPIGVAALEQGLDERHDRRRCARSPAAGRRVSSSGAPRRPRRTPRGTARRGPDVDAGRGCAADDLVVDVGDVHDPRHRVAPPAQVADEEVGEQERPEVPDVGGPVDRRSARVDADAAVADRVERTGLAGKGVVQLGWSSIDARGPPSRWQRRDRPARPLRSVEVAGGRLHVDRAAIEPEAARRSRHASRRGSGQSRPGTDDRHVHAAGRQPAPASRVATSARSSPLAMPRGVAGRPGRPPEIAEAGRTEQRVADRMERDVTVGVAVEPRGTGDDDAAERQRRCRARTGACRARSPARPAAAGQDGSATREIGGQVTLRLSGSPRTTWTGMVQASSREASSVHVSAAVGGNGR